MDRLLALRCHLAPPPRPPRARALAAAADDTADGATILSDIVAQGYHVLGPQSLRMPAQRHDEIYERCVARWRADGGYSKGKADTLGDMAGRLHSHVLPELREVLSAPGLVDAVEAILGPRWALQPFIHSLFLQDGTRNRQEWHADDNAPQNTRRMRHHRPLQLQLFCPRHGRHPRPA